MEGAQVLVDALTALRDDTGLAPAAGLEPEPEPLEQENSIEHSGEDDGEWREGQEDESISVIGSALFE